MSELVAAFLEQLDPELRRRAHSQFDAPDHRRWTYVPGDRPGLMLAEMTDDQRHAALALLDVACSASGAMTSRAVIDLDRIRRGLSGGLSEPPTDDRFWIRVLGDPRGDEPWAWRINGHHLAVHVTVVGAEIAVTPQFFGAEPAVVPDGPYRGLRTLPNEEELARTVLARLEPAQRARAITSVVAPEDIATRDDPVANPEVVPTGVSYGALTAVQQDTLGRLIRLYFDRATPAVADEAWRAAIDAGMDRVTFAWAGPVERGHGHYYAVRGPTFLLEYDNTQDDANHVHSVWRDLRRDWGEDLLSGHYTTAHH